MNHPSKSQLKAQFDKSFYGVGMTGILDKIYDECFYCAAQKKIPSTTIHHSKTDAKVPGSHFHADIIRRQSQFIFTIRDHISSYTVAKIVKNETHTELRKAVVDTIHPFKLHGECIVKVDNARGFLPLLNKKDPELAKLNINLQATDVHNKNSNSVIDRACQELEDELKRIEPDGRPISNTTLQQAVSNLNIKLRRKGQISAYEMHFNRDMNTGENLNLDYKKIAEEQRKTRAKVNEQHNKTVQPPENPQPGDTVVVKTKDHKHKAKDIFLVTKTDQDKVTMHRILHPHSDQPKIRAQQYLTDSHRLHITRRHHHHQQYLQQQNLQQQNLQQQNLQQKICKKSQWNPVRNDMYESDTDIEENEQQTAIRNVQQINASNVIHENNPNESDTWADIELQIHEDSNQELQNPEDEESLAQQVQSEPEKHSEPIDNTVNIQYQSFVRLQHTPPPHKNQHICELENWIETNRIAVAQQLQRANSEENLPISRSSTPKRVTSTPNKATPSPPLSPADTPPRAQRNQKSLATAKITTIYESFRRKKKSSTNPKLLSPAIANVPTDGDDEETAEDTEPADTDTDTRSHASMDWDNLQTQYSEDDLNDAFFSPMHSYTLQSSASDHDDHIHTECVEPDDAILPSDHSSQEGGRYIQ